MKTTTTKYVTKLIVAKNFTYADMGDEKRTIKAGRVLEIKKHKYNHYYPWAYRIVMGHGIGETIPVEYLKVKWYKETRTVIIKNKEMKVLAKIA